MTTTRAVPDRFLVAFSLAGEQRDRVRAIATAVENVLGRSTVFFDEWYEHFLAGSDADLALQEIYAHKCELAVVCVSANYNDKPWTRAEHRAIRARYDWASDSNERRRVLPVRVGDGDVEGIVLNAIVPDLRQRSVGDSAQLIIDRLSLVYSIDAPQPSVEGGWPQEAPEMHWPLADHTAVRQAFASLVTRDALNRLLTIRGESETGKSTVSRQMQRNTLAIPALDCGRFDFKGGVTGSEAELTMFADALHVAKPTGDNLNERLSSVLAALRARAKPTVLVFDTYEASGTARDWIEGGLLPSLIRSPWLRVVILGQSVPARGPAVWDATHIDLQRPTPDDWYQFLKISRPDSPTLTLEFVTTLYDLTNGAPTNLVGLLGPR